MTGPVRIRHAEPADYEAVCRIFQGPRAVWGTLQLPFPSLERWRRRLADPAEGIYTLVACAGEEVVGMLSLQTFPNFPRRRHVAELFMAVRDDWQGRGVGTALMAAALDLADNWLNILRVELDVWVDNEPAIRLYKKFGFAVEGTAAAFGYREGKFVDAYRMARVRRPD
jgi:putative acetyltransferase